MRKVHKGIDCRKEREKMLKKRKYEEFLKFAAENRE
jgi:hypothetical protein